MPALKSKVDKYYQENIALHVNKFTYQTFE